MLIVTPLVLNVPFGTVVLKVTFFTINDFLLHHLYILYFYYYQLILIALTVVNILTISRTGWKIAA